MAIYQTLSILLSPLIDLYLFIRKLKAKEDKARFSERLGFASIKRPQGKLLWIHCASVGESNSVWPLINKFLENFPQIHILFTSGTVTSANQIAKKIPSNRVIHQFIPVDKYFAVKRFLRHWNPDFAMLVESEIWPNLVCETKKSGCNLALINARISKKSFKRWRFFEKIGFNIFSNFSVCFAQSKKDLERFLALGLKESYYLGNLKTIPLDPKINQEQLEQLQNQIGSRKIWLAASTHKGEEEIIAETHKALKKNFPDLLTVIALRHPHRLAEVVEALPKDLTIAVRSKNQKINSKNDIYIVDSLGELSLFYRLCKIALIGGSMIDNIGGHNPFEAIKAGCVPISGRFVANFEESYDNLKENNSCFMVKDSDQLYEIIYSLLNDNVKVSNTLETAQNLLREQIGILDEIVFKIKNYFKLG